MKNKEVKGILALVVVTALSFGVIAGSRALAQDMTGNTQTGETAVVEEYDVSGTENIDSAAKTEDGYLVTVREKGYGGDIVLNVAFDDTAATISKVEVVEQSETEGLGAKIAEPEFLSQFEGVSAPVYLPGMSAEGDDTSAASQEESTAEDNAALEALEGAELTDGTYTASTDSYDDSGFMDEVSLTVKDGKITEVTWDAVTEDGSKKSVMSENGEYVMTEDGPTWKEQAEALADALVENQSLGFFNTDEAGKTDSVSGVSISIGGFISLAQQCLEEAAGMEASQNPLNGAELTDGTYTASTDSYDDSGFMDEVSLTVKDGKITDVTWDAVTEDGSKKSVMSENGEYVMTEDGPTWKEQAEALADALVENQSLGFFNTDEAGKTDSVSGVSISIGGFISLAEQCLAEAAGVELPAEEAKAEDTTAEDTTEADDTAAENADSAASGTVDGISGATISSTAAVTAINNAYSFLQTVK